MRILPVRKLSCFSRRSRYLKSLIKQGTFHWRIVLSSSANSRVFKYGVGIVISCLLNDGQVVMLARRRASPLSAAAAHHEIAITICWAWFRVVRLSSRRNPCQARLKLAAWRTLLLRSLSQWDHLWPDGPHLSIAGTKVVPSSSVAGVRSSMAPRPRYSRSISSTAWVPKHRLKALAGTMEINSAEMLSEIVVWWY